MKLLAIFFAFYMLTLACVPCLCTYADCTKNKTEKQNTNSDHNDDSCTPFCNCACGHFVIHNFKPIIFTKKIKAFQCKLTFPTFSTRFISYNYQSIWQPPKLS